MAAYPLSYLSDLLCADGEVRIDLKRSDEVSGLGSGQVWATELAPPIWSVQVSLPALHRDRAREIDAKVRGLQGSQKTFLISDRFYRKSVAGPVVVASIGADRTKLALSGLPAGHVIRAGDRFSLSYGGRVYFAEFLEPLTASGAGATMQAAVYPFIPFGVTVGAEVQLNRPVLEVFVPPDGYTPFSGGRGRWSRGASLTVWQRV